MNEISETKRNLIISFLEMQVPLYIMELKNQGITPGTSEFNRQLQECADVIAHEGDTILYKTDKTAKNVSKLSKGIALMVLNCGEVTFLGIKFTDPFKNSSINL